MDLGHETPAGHPKKDRIPEKLNKALTNSISMWGT
jgi:hypothetical protein